MDKQFVFNPNPATISPDNCPSFAQVNRGCNTNQLGLASIVSIVVNPTNWNRELAYVHLHPRTKRWEKLKILASSWVTCACGNTCVVIPREKDTGVPYDKTLSRLGIEFYNAILNKRASKALLVLDRIEKRSQLIINRIYADLKTNTAIADSKKKDEAG